MTAATSDDTQMTTTTTRNRPTLDELRPHFGKWEIVGDLIDQSIDLMLNLRQSGHPGGSRSKVPFMVATTLGAGMRYARRLQRGAAHHARAHR